MGIMEIPLRELNYAKRRLKILDTVMEKLKVKKYQDISVEEICKEAEISRGTFFNYFSSKDQVLVYYGMFFCIQIIKWLQQEDNKNKSVFDKMKYIFNFSVQQIQAHPYLLDTYICHVLGKNKLASKIKITAPEIILRYPGEDLPDIDSIMEQCSLYNIFSNLLNEGVAANQIKEDIDFGNTLLTLIAILFSPPLSISYTGLNYDIDKFYNYNLNLVFNDIST